MRATLLALAVLSAPATAETLSEEIARAGLGPTEARLAALPTPTPEDLFALAGLRFLGGVEAALQLRWQTGIDSDWSDLPILRLSIPDNPAPRDFVPADFTRLIQDLDADMAAARTALDQLGEAPFTLDVRMADLWFDINANGTRDQGEEIGAVVGMALGGRMVDGQMQGPTVSFDTADAAWLKAYTHFLSAASTLALAYDPEPAIQRVLDSSTAIYALWGDTPPRDAMDMLFGRTVDRAAMALLALSKAPDQARISVTYDHLLAMLRENRRFWSLVAQETDQGQEWIPNDQQTSAIGVQLPQGTGERWQAVLADAEKVLLGQALVPHWRFGAEAGINVKKMFENPPAVDLVTWIQGEGLLPYAEKGPLIDTANWREFDQLVRGNGAFFAAFLN